MDNEYSIDFVITWVDGSDPEWINKRNYYSGKRSYINAHQYRDWEFLPYWFRGVQKFAPWVRKVFFVTDGQRPDWLIENDKLVLVDHKDFIPSQYLPTFNPHTIELNFHRIEGLSEHFVYFNDDMFLTDTVSPETFFVNGIPCDTAVLSALAPSVIGDYFAHTLCNNIALLNKYFDKKAVISKHPTQWFNWKYGINGTLRTILTFGASRYFTGLKNYHLPSSMEKKTYIKLWDLEYDLFDRTCETKFREATDVNQYVFTWYNICQGHFVPRSPSVGQYYMVGKDDNDIINCILKRKYKMICINDNPGEFDFTLSKTRILEAFQSVFPQKSAFEA